MASSQRIKQLEKAIADHLKTVGAQHWEEVKQDFPDVPPSSFWRHMKRVKAQIGWNANLSTTSDLFSEEEKKQELAEPWQKPNPYTAYSALNHAQRYFELEMDLLALKSHAMDANGKIRDPQLFAKIIRLRQQLLNDEITVVGGVYNNEFLTNLVDKLRDEMPQLPREAAEALQRSLTRIGTNPDENRPQG